MDKTVSIFSILSGFKAPHITHLLKFFLNSIHGFDLVWKEKQQDATERTLRRRGCETN